MKKIIIALGLVLPTLVHAQIDRSVRPQAAKAPTINIKDSEVFTTKNGITVILSENHKMPRVTFDFIMGSTPRSFGDYAGLPEIAGSLITSGTTNRSKDQIDNEIDYIGADLRADKNSVTISCLTKHLDKALNITSDILVNANFPQSEVDRIKAQYESNLISMKSDADAMASNAESVANFPKDHPYADVMTPESLAKINREVVEMYYRSVFTPKGSYLVVVGDINKAQVEEFLNKFFATWNGVEQYTAELPEGLVNSGNRVLFVKKPGAVQSVIYVSFPMDVTPGHEDYIALKVLNGILGGGGFGTRLMQNLREDKAYTYGCYSSLNVNTEGSWLSAGGNFRNEVTDSAITQILMELGGITTDFVSNEELALTKSSMAGGFARSLESPATIARFALSIIKNDLPKDYYQTYLKKLEAVSKEDILRVAKKYFVTDKCNIVVVGNDEILDRLKVFDADGKLEKLDAFGNEIKETKPADISVDELISRYVTKLTKSSTMTEAEVKVKKLKSMATDMEFSNPQIPFPLKSSEIWISPNQSASKMEMNGMALNKEYFDGKTGGSVNMQSGKKEYTETEISAKKKSSGLIPEMNYKTSGMEYEIIGIETFNNADCYVMKINDGESITFDYFDIDTYMKLGSMNIKAEEGETQETTVLYSDYTEFEGMLFPQTINMSVSGMTLNGKVVARKFNESLTIEPFQ